MKKCSKCFVEKEISDFFKSGVHKSGTAKVRGDCKVCASRETSNWRIKNRQKYNSYTADWRTRNPDKIRAVDMKRKYGITIDDYQRMLEKQGFTCKICKSGPKGRRPLAVDHDHVSDKVRGLLCYRCNRAIAILDDQDHLKRAVEYLKLSMRD